MAFKSYKTVLRYINLLFSSALNALLRHLHPEYLNCVQAQMQIRVTESSGFVYKPLFSSLLTLQVVVVWVLGHPPVQERPGQVIHSILLVLNRLCHYLSIEVIV